MWFTEQRTCKCRWQIQDIWQIAGKCSVVWCYLAFIHKSQNIYYLYIFHILKNWSNLFLPFLRKIHLGFSRLMNLAINIMDGRSSPELISDQLLTCQMSESWRDLETFLLSRIRWRELILIRIDIVTSGKQDLSKVLFRFFSIH